MNKNRSITQHDRILLELAEDVVSTLSPGILYKKALDETLMFAILNPEVDWEQQDLDRMLHVHNQLGRLLLFEEAVNLPEAVRKEVLNG